MSRVYTLAELKTALAHSVGAFFDYSAEMFAG